MKKLLYLLLLIPFIVYAEDKYLYDVLKSEAESNGLAREYTGEHHDSFTLEPSKKIYHWYANNSEEGNQVLDKNNVIFGNDCWQMIRTTDSGGVKMLYNGEAENDKCLKTRNPHYVENKTSISFTSGINYYFASTYNYDPSTQSFSLGEDKFASEWNEETAPTLLGKYTCMSPEENACYVLYKLVDYTNPSWGINSIYYMKLPYQIMGYSKFNSGGTIGDIGYKTNRKVESNSFSFHQKNIDKFEKVKYVANSRTTPSLSYYYSDDVKYENGKYTLLNPKKLTDISQIKGKYTHRSTSSTYSFSSVKYVIGTSYYDGTGDQKVMHFFELTGGETISDYSPMIIGDGYTDNNDGTYTLTNPTGIEFKDWIELNETLKYKYTCGTITSTCFDLKLIAIPHVNRYYYVVPTETMYISKSRNGLNLQDGKLFNLDDYFINVDNYLDYKFICSNDITNNVCTEDNLSKILYRWPAGLGVVYNHYFGKSFEYKDGYYTLKDYIEFDDIENLNNYSDYHYFCNENNQKKCASLGYIHWGQNYYIRYFTLENGEDIDDLLNESLKVNTDDSMLKEVIDKWYNNHIIDYSDYLEDTIYCNDRSFKNKAGLNKNGGKITELTEFGATSDLICQNKEDSFSIFNNKAKLEFPIATITASEASLLGDPSMLKVGNYSYWTLTPSSYYKHNSTNQFYIINSNGSLYNFYSTSDQNYIRPMISLMSNIKYLSGNGSEENPYILDYSFELNIESDDDKGSIKVLNEKTKQLNKGDKINLIINPKKGYELYTIEIKDRNNKLIEYSKKNNKYTFTMPGSNVTIKPIFIKTKKEYKFIEGMNQNYNITRDSRLRFRVNMEYKDFINGGKVYIDKKDVDPKYYELSEGSTIIIFDDEYSKSLSSGKHEIVTMLSDGSSATTNFTISESIIIDSIVNKIVNPNTGDKIILAVILLTISLFIYNYLKHKKMKVN